MILSPPGLHYGRGPNAATSVSADVVLWRSPIDHCWSGLGEHAVSVTAAEGHTGTQFRREELQHGDQEQSCVAFHGDDSSMGVSADVGLPLGGIGSRTALTIALTTVSHARKLCATAVIVMYPLFAADNSVTDAVFLQQ